MLYVRMLDTFMSNWGEANGKKSIYVVECESAAQAEQVAAAARRRPEMSGIKIQLRPPKASDNARLTQVAFADLGQIWKS